MRQAKDYTVLACLLGDDRQRWYPVAWQGWGEIWLDEGPIGARLALVTLPSGREALVYRVGRGAWTSAGTASVRDLRGSPSSAVPTQERLDAAV